MKKSSIPACIRLVLALILTIGTRTFLQPCIHEDGNYGSCHNAGLVLTGIGAALAVLALAGLLVRSAKIRINLLVLSGALGLLAELVPGSIIPLCMMNTMRCNLIMRPAALVLSMLIMIMVFLEILMISLGGKKV